MLLEEDLVLSSIVHGGEEDCALAISTWADSGVLSALLVVGEGYLCVLLADFFTRSTLIFIVISVEKYDQIVGSWVVNYEVLIPSGVQRNDVVLRDGAQLPELLSLITAYVALRSSKCQ